LTPAVFVAISGGCWFGLGLQAALLWRRLFPQLRDSAFLVSVLVVSPIVVQTQFTTVTTSLPTQIPVLLSIGGLLLLLKENVPAISMAVAAILVGLSVVLSEYGLAASLGALVILVGARPRARAMLFAAATAIGYGTFRAVSDLKTRPNVDPEAVTRSLSLLNVPLEAVAGVWNAVAGAYGTAAAALHPTIRYSSLLLAAICGVVVAAAVYLAFRRTAWPAPDTKSNRVFCWLLGATMVGVTCVCLAGRTTGMPGFPSRFLTPILPFAPAVTVYLIHALVKPRFVPGAFALFGLLAGNAMVTRGAQAVMERRVLEEASERLRPLVSTSGDLTVAVLGGGIGAGYVLTGGVTWAWDRENAARIWIFSEAEARVQLGGRLDCRVARTLAIESVRGIARRGEVDRIVYVPVVSGRVGEVQPYCLAPRTNLMPGASEHAPG
jgi:hypothetical protein